MPDAQTPTPSFKDLLEQHQDFLRGLESLEAQVTGELADRLAAQGKLRERLESAQVELGQLREAQRAWALERARLLEEIERRRTELDSEKAAFAEERLQLESERKEATARFEEERVELEGRVKAREASLEQARHDAEAAQAELESLQAVQLGWATERQRFAAEQDRLRGLSESQEREVSKLRAQLTAVSADLETYQSYQLQWAAEREEHIKAATDAQGRFEALVAQTSKQSGDATARRQALVTEIQQLNQELTRALEALARNQERDRQREKVVEDLRQTWQKEKTELEIEIRQARERGGVALPQEQIHALNSQLNAITGFSELLGQESANAITPEERLEFLRLINQSATRLAHDLAMVFAPTAPEDAPEPAGAAGPAPRKMPAVLVADPDAATWKRMEPLLVRAGYELIVTADGPSAIERALQLQPIAVLIDTGIPPRGALGLVQDLKREARTRDVPIVITTGEEQADLSPELTQPVLRKPIDRQQLLQILVKHDLLADSRRARKMPTTVLMIDDDRQHVRLIKALFKPFTTRLLTAETEREGLELAQTSPPDLVILDLSLPNGDGFAAVDTLRDAPATAQTPIIVYTARRLRKEEVARLQGRVETVIYKGDFNRERLLDLILKRGERRGRAGRAAPSAASHA